jgi:hypothetical protein
LTDVVRGPVATAGLSSAALFALAGFVAFGSAFGAVNRYNSDTTATWNWFVVGLAASVVALGLALWVGDRGVKHITFLSTGAGLGLLSGLVLTNDVMGTLGPGGHQHWIGNQGWILGLLVIPVTVAVLLWRAGATMWARNTVALAVAFHAALYIALLTYLVLDYANLAAEARRVNPESPAWGAITAGLALLFATWRRRRGVSEATGS